MFSLFVKTRAPDFPLSYYRQNMLMYSACNRLSMSISFTYEHKRRDAISKYERSLEKAIENENSATTYLLNSIYIAVLTVTNTERERKRLSVDTTPDLENIPSGGKMM